jgi:magnesium transporter
MIRAFIHTGGDKIKETSDADEMAREIKAAKHTIWVDFEKPTEKELGYLHSKFGFHPLTHEDVMHENQRPKIDDYDKYAFIVVRGVGEGGVEDTSQLNIYLSRTFIVTVNRRPIMGEEEVIAKVRRNPLILKRGPDFVAYSLLDAVVDEFFPVLQDLDDKLDDIEDRIFVKTDIKTLEKLFKIKRRVIAVRRVAWPMRDILNILARRDFRFIKADNAIYFRDVYDHLVRISEMTDTLRDMITSGMEGYLSVISNNLNVIMKKLTAITALIMVPALIAGIFGMNFDNIPELHGEWGFYWSLVLMFLAVVATFAYLKWNDWV